MRKIAISDIHGFADTLKELLYEKLDVTQADRLFFLGDYVDRGPDSKGVLDEVMALQDAGIVEACLMGNHEQMMLDARYDRRQYDLWMANGGEAALESFGVASIEHIPKKYWDFLDSLGYCYQVDNYILVHAGLNFRAPDPLKDFSSMMWIRRWYEQIDKFWLGNRKIIHGHTPTDYHMIRAMLKSDEYPVQNIDNGCYATWRRRMGSLCAFDFSSQVLHFQQNIG